MHQPNRGVVRIRLQGEFDISDKERLTELLIPAETADTAIIDMSGTTYIDTTALSCLIHLKRQLLTRKGTVHLVGVRPQIRKLFAITSLDQLFEISEYRETTREAAKVSQLKRGNQVVRASQEAAQ